MNHKERMRRAVCHEPVDRLPTQIGYTKAMGEKLAAHFNVTLEELPARLDNHMIRVDLSFPTRLSTDRLIRYDWWGVGFATQEEGYFPATALWRKPLIWTSSPGPTRMIRTCWTRRRASLPLTMANTSLRPTLASHCSSGRGAARLREFSDRYGCRSGLCC